MGFPIEFFFFLVALLGSFVLTLAGAWSLAERYWRADRLALLAIREARAPGAIILPRGGPPPPNTEPLGLAFGEVVVTTGRAQALSYQLFGQYLATDTDPISAELELGRQEALARLKSALPGATHLAGIELLVTAFETDDDPGPDRRAFHILAYATAFKALPAPTSYGSDSRPDRQ